MVTYFSSVFFCKKRVTFLENLINNKTNDKNYKIELLTQLSI